MIVNISGDAETDIAEGYWFYEEQSKGLGDYFRDCIVADIDSLAFYGGIHEIAYGYHRKLASRFPFVIYYRVDDEIFTIVAVLDAREEILRGLEIGCLDGCPSAVINAKRFVFCDSKRRPLAVTVKRSGVSLNSLERRA